MHLICKILIVLLITLPSCAGVDSVTKKSWSNSENTISIVDMTSKDFRLMDAGSVSYTHLTLPTIYSV